MADVGRILKRRISITLTAAQAKAIDRLIEHGIFGLKKGDVVRRMVDDAIRQRAEDGWIDRDDREFVPKPRKR